VEITILWQSLDQCPIEVQSINLKSRYLVGNTSCVIYKKTQQGTITVFYWLFILSIHGLCYNYASYPNVHALSSCPLVIYLMSYYSSTIHLSQGHHAMSMCPDIILFNLCHTCVHHKELLSLDVILTLNSS